MRSLTTAGEGRFLQREYPTPEHPVGRACNDGEAPGLLWCIMPGQSVSSAPIALRIQQLRFLLQLGDNGDFVEGTASI